MLLVEMVFDARRITDAPGLLLSLRSEPVNESGAPERVPQRVSI